METNKINAFEKFALRYSNSIFKTDRQITSFKAISSVIMAFTLLAIAAFVYKAYLFGIHEATSFKLMTSSTNISALLASNPSAFYVAIFFEILRLMIIAFSAYYLASFLGSIRSKEPFSNAVSRNKIIALAFLSMVFFCVDVCGSLFLMYYEEYLDTDTRISVFRVEFLVITYFINVFALIFKKGTEIKDEIDLVI